MDSTETAAVIAAASAGGVGVVSLLATVWTAQYTARAGRQAAQDQRVWEKRASVYEDVLAEALKQQHQRREDLRGYTFDRVTEQATREWLDA